MSVIGAKVEALGARMRMKWATVGAILPIFTGGVNNFGASYSIPLKTRGEESISFTHYSFI